MAPDPDYHHGAHCRDDFMKTRDRKTERNKEIYALRQSGVIYRQIAERFDISIIRVRQIVEAEAAKEQNNE